MIRSMNCSIEKSFQVENSSENEETYFLKKIVASDNGSKLNDQNISHQEVILNEQLNAVDLGLISETISQNDVLLRHTTTINCFCLFPTCWGNPCRHIFRIYLENSLNHMPKGAISIFWYKKMKSKILDYSTNYFLQNRILFQWCQQTHLKPKMNGMKY